MPVSQEEGQIFDSSYPLRIGGEGNEGREYEAVMMCDRDWGDYENWIKSRYIALASQAGDQLNPLHRKELLEAAIGASLGIDSNSPEGQAILYSDLGVLRLGWQICRKRTPNLQFQYFESIARGKDDKYLKQSIANIFLTYNLLHPKKKEDASSGDIGGSSTENSKSE